VRLSRRAKWASPLLDRKLFDSSSCDISTITRKRRMGSPDEYGVEPSSKKKKT
jgi:hypothetical protein